MKFSSNEKQRIKKFFIKCAIVIAVGLGYALFIKLTGKGIPCVYFLITKNFCPGCGISRMCLALLSLDIRSAIEYNALIMLFLPFATFLGIRRTVIYIKKGTHEIDRLEAVFLIAAFILTIAFWIARNTETFAWLAP